MKMNLVLAKSKNPIQHRAHLKACLRALQSDRRFWLSQSPKAPGRVKALQRLEQAIWKAQVALDTM